jgi:hypothetical protein
MTRHRDGVIEMMARPLKRAFQAVALIVAGLLVAALVGLWGENQNNPLMPSGQQSPNF